MSTKHTRRDIEAILKQDSDIVTVHWPQEWSFGKINRDLWSKDAETREEHIHLIEEYLKRPCIEDTFEGDYLARKMWKGKFRDGEWGVWWHWYKDQDALRWGTMRTIPSFCEWLLDNYIGNDIQTIQSAISKVRQTTPATFQEYDKNSTAKKMALVAELKENVYRVLQYFYQPSPTS